MTSVFGALRYDTACTKWGASASGHTDPQSPDGVRLIKLRTCDITNIGKPTPTCSCDIANIGKQAEVTSQYRFYNGT